VHVEAEAASIVDRLGADLVLEELAKSDRGRSG
jgi:hypothetical protein